MITIRLAAAMVGLLIPHFLAGCDARGADKEEMEQVYSDYMAFNNARNGRAIPPLLTAESIAVYDRLLKIGLDGKADEVKGLPPCEQLEVMTMRARGKRSELAKLSGQEYIEFATSQGWYVIAPEDRTLDTLRKFRFSKDGSATAELVCDGDPTGVRFRFVKQGDRWLFDEVHASRQWDGLLRLQARDSGLSEDEFLLEVLSDDLGREVPADTIWEPMADDRKPAASEVIKPAKPGAKKKKK